MYKIRRIPLILMLTALTTCSAAREPCIHYVDCPSGTANCRQYALEACPSGYRIFDESSLGDGFSAFSQAHFDGAAAGTPHILVTCNP